MTTCKQCFIPAVQDGNNPNKEVCPSCGEECLPEPRKALFQRRSVFVGVVACLLLCMAVTGFYVHATSMNVERCSRPRTFLSVEEVRQGQVYCQKNGWTSNTRVHSSGKPVSVSCNVATNGVEYVVDSKCGTIKGKDQ